MHKVLSIAGFDGSGGAGIQADLKTFSAFGCFGMTVLTALPIQNTMGVKRCHPIPPIVVREQLETILEDIVPDAIKIGMLFQVEIIEVVAAFLKERAQGIPVILDPVMVTTSGDLLLHLDAIESLKESLIPLALLITPNFPEGCRLTAQDPSFGMETIASKLLDLDAQAVLLKGGHLPGREASDLYVDQQGNQRWLREEKIRTKNTHGTGCTLSAAIASCIALGYPLLESCERSKTYLSGALLAAKDLRIGQGAGPVHHFYHFEEVSL